MSIFSPSESKFLKEIIKNPEENYGKVVSLMENKIQECATELELHKLQEPEQRYRELYENAPNAYFSIDLAKNIKMCNQAAVELLGYSKEKLLNMKLFDLYADTPEGLPKAQELFHKFLNGTPIKDEELQMKHKSGKLVWISLTVNSVKDKAGNITESRSMIIDITKRKLVDHKLLESEQRLTQSEERLKYLISSNPALIYTSKVTDDYGATFISDNVKKNGGMIQQNLLKIQIFG